jgi:hypothetical protein
VYGISRQRDELFSSAPVFRQFRRDSAIVFLKPSWKVDRNRS